MTWTDVPRPEAVKQILVMMEDGKDGQFEGHVSVERVMFSSRALSPIPSLIEGKK